MYNFNNSMDYRIAAGKVVDKLLNMFNSYLVEKISFPDGLRYRVRILDAEDKFLDVDVVNRFDKLFIELWLPNYATPFLVIERSAHENVDDIVRDVARIITILWRVRKRRKATPIRRT